MLANSPDLNPLVYFAWGFLQGRADLEKPKCRDALKVAIRDAVGDMPVGMARQAVLDFG